MEKDEPLPITHLQKRVRPSTYSWLVSDEEKQTKEKEAMEDDEAAVATAMFTQLYNEKFSTTTVAHRPKGDAIDGVINVDFEEDNDSSFLRVHEWCSSFIHPDGWGGINDVSYGIKEEEEVDEENTLRVKYILSEASGGHGDDLWAAARHIANMFADAEKCRQLLGNDFLHARRYYEDGRRSDNDDDENHPLMGLDFIELGAGAGVPSWIAMKCGARVVCTDQGIPNRIRCIAECAARNLHDMKNEIKLEEKNAMELLSNAEKATAHPYDWGNSVDEIVDIINDTREQRDSEKLFDIVMAADCIYMPAFHSPLLESIRMLLSPSGVAFLPFALHGNTKDDNVWSIVDIAKDKGFDIEVLDSKQLTPQGAFMDAKRALVNMLRLRKSHE